MSLNAATVCCLPDETDSNRLMKDILPNEAGKLICPPQTREQRDTAYKVVGSICDRELRKYCLNSDPENILSESCVKWCNASDNNKNDCKRVVKKICVGPTLSNNKFCSVDYCGPNESSDFGWCEDNINTYCNSVDTFSEPICQKFCNNPNKKEPVCDARVRKFCTQLNNKPEYCTCFKKLKEIPGWESGSYPEYESLVHCLARPCVEGKAYLTSQQIVRGCPASTSINIPASFDSPPKPISPTMTSSVSGTTFKPVPSPTDTSLSAPSESSPNMLFIGIGIAVVLLIIIFFVMKSRSSGNLYGSLY